MAPAGDSMAVDKSPAAMAASPRPDQIPMAVLPADYQVAWQPCQPGGGQGQEERFTELDPALACSGFPKWLRTCRLPRGELEAFNRVLSLTVSSRDSPAVEC